MFNFNELRQIHLEITNNCQASCPMCIRNVHGGIENTLIELESWSLDRYKTIINKEVIDQVKQLYFCGNYGDPLLNNNLLDMVKYTVETKQNIEIRIHTNGSLRNKAWWIDLAKSLPDNHRVIFAIDGLQDTHSIYRIGTDFNKIIENAKAFIDAGGRAEWAYIRFKHNEHQAETAKQLASELNFEEFTMKDSSRFLLESKFPVYNSNRETIYHLEPSQYSEIKFIDRNVITNYKNIVSKTTINCFALKHKEIYITAQGTVFPCCWLPQIIYQAQDELSDMIPIRNEILKQYYELTERLGNISADTKSIKEIINSTEYQSVWDYFWTENKLITCVRSCGVMPDVFSTPRDQFIETTNLNTQ